MASKLNIGVPVYIAAALAIIGGAAFYYLTYLSPKPSEEVTLTPEAKAYVRNLQLADVEMKANESYLKQMVIEIEGKIGNAGDRPLQNVDIYCVFYDRYGQLVRRVRTPIVSQRMGGLKPGETKSFRLPFDDVPESWNHKMPNLVIASVKFS